MVKSKRKANNDNESSPRRLSRRLNKLQKDGTPVRTSLRLKEVSVSKMSSKKNICKKNSSTSSTENPIIVADIQAERQCYNDNTLTPHRFSSRLNNLQRDGTPVRRSDHINNSSHRKISARKNLAVSITQSARIASRSRKRKVSSSIYDLDYCEKTKQKNLLVSPSQLSNQDINETILLSPVELDNEYVINSNPKEISKSNRRIINADSITEKNVEQNLRIFNEKNESISEFYYDGLCNSQIINSEKSHSESESDMEVTVNDNIEDGEAPPILDENNTIHRICYCDMLTLPLDCEDYNIQLCIPCGRHIIMNCFICDKKMHKGCLEDYLGEDLNDLNE